MSRILFTIAFLAVAFAAEEDVVVLTMDNFDEHLKANKYTLVEFYAPWCGHCKKLAPEYEGAAEVLKGKVLLGKVDATIEKELAEKFAVRGYPTLYFFIDGKEMEYDGGRDKDGIISWVESMSGPAVKEVESAEEAGEKASVVLYARELAASFESLATTNRKGGSFQFIKSETSKLVVTHKGEESIEMTDSDIISDSEKLEAFWQENSFPLFGELNGETYGKYMARPTGLIWSLFQMDTSEDLPKVVADNRETMVAVAAAQKGKYSVSFTDTVQFKGAVENMLGVKEFPALVAFKKAGDKTKFVYNGDMTVDAINAWLAGIDDGSITATLRSEEEPTPNDSPVKVIVGSTLEKEVFQAETDVLLEVYAPWCGHCKKLEPEFEKVAKKIRKEGLEDVVRLAKMDGTSNDSPNAEIQWDGFPAIFYAKAGDSTPVKYDGARDAKGIWKWIKKNHSKADKIAERVKANKEASTTEKEEKEEL